MPTLAFPDAPPPEVLDYFDRKGLRVGFDHRDVWREEHAHAFTVAKATEQDVLTAIRDEVRRAIAEGRTLEEFQRELTSTLQRLGWWGMQRRTDPVTGKTPIVELGSPRRLKTIFDTNMRVARAAGQWQRVQRTKATHPNLLYGLGPSARHRPEHAAWSGTILPADHEWWTTHFPPNGWGCKCHVVQLSDAQTRKRGGVSPDPVVQLVGFTNVRTGEITQVPKGIDPGWDYNPGAVSRRPPPPSSPPAREPAPPRPSRGGSVQDARWVREVAPDAVGAPRGTFNEASLNDVLARGVPRSEDQVEARTQLRELMARYGLTDPKIERPDLFPRANAVEWRAGMREAAQHVVSGLVRLSQDVSGQLERWGRGARDDAASGAVRVLVHEALHAGGLKPAAYVNAGRRIEDVTTELCARRIVREAFGIPVEPTKAGATFVDEKGRRARVGGYQAAIDHVVADIRAVAKLGAVSLSRVQAGELLERASFAFRVQAADVTSASAAAELLARQLGAELELADEQAVVFTAALRQRWEDRWRF